MRKIKWYFNLIIFCIYSIDYKLHLFFNKINPIYLFLPSKKQKKRDIKFIDEVNKAFKNPDYGISTIRAVGTFYGIMFLFFLGIINLYSIAIGKYIDLSEIHYTILFIITVLIAYFITEQNNKYRYYFKTYASLSKSELKFWSIFSLVILLFLILVFIGSFFLMDYFLSPAAGAPAN